MSKIDPYKLLGVDKNDNIETLKTNYYNLALIMHPENGGNLQEMAILKKCYDICFEKKDEIIDLLTFTFIDIPKMYELYDECIMDMSKFRKSKCLYKDDNTDLLESYTNGQLENPNKCDSTLEFSYIF